jgi:flavin-binding protein dodecin
MATPYERVESTKTGLSALRQRGSITLEGVEDLLAQAECVRHVTAEMVSSICDARRIDLARRQKRGRMDLYRRYLRHCFEDNVLSDDEREDLAHLRVLLHLSAEDLQVVHDEVAIEVYGEAVEEVLDDFRLDDDEADFLRGLRQTLGLDEDKAQRIYSEGSSKARTRAYSQAVALDHQFIEHRVPAGEFSGRSNESLEHAIQDAITRATLAIPTLYWFEVSLIGGYVGEGESDRWYVNVRAGTRKEQP